MARNVTNIAASVHQRLLNRARETGRPFDEVLQHFAIERFLYRLSKSPHADRFILKGALMLSVWGGAGSRPTKDIDFLGHIDNSLDYIAEAMSEVCETNVEADGMLYDGDSVAATRITEDAAYHGVRVRLKAALGKARISMQVDVGIGDVLFPEPQGVEYPALLDFPRARLKGYAMESSIAEKFQAMIVLGILNSRMKDFYDIWMLSRTYDFEGEALAGAIEKTFEARNTELTAEATVFDPSFANEAGKQAQWTAFLRKSNLGDAPSSFSEVVHAVGSFLRPVVRVLAEGGAFDLTWKAPGPWR